MPDPFDNPEEYRRLLANVLKGDWIAERTLVDYLGPTVRLAVHQHAPPKLWEDLIQDVWAHLWARNCRVLQRWNGEGPFLGFVWVVARNKVRDKLAAQAPPTAPIEEAPDIADPDDPELNAEMIQLAECIRRARACLSCTHQEIIHLRHDLDLSHQEIAERLSRTTGYVGPTLARAEDKLREKVSETCHDHLGTFGIIFGQDE
jgi:RNA polymerase sigma factor (sigma-70 family)